jgi:hypothetical protein
MWLQSTIAILNLRIDGLYSFIMYFGKATGKPHLKITVKI